MKKKSLLLILGLYLLSSAASFGLFSYFGAQPGSAMINSGTNTVDDGSETMLGALLEIDPSEALDQVCPLNGQLYTQTERNSWEQRRPLAVMIENHPDARPQSGLSDADVVFEAIAEGGVTRFMGIYYCETQQFDTTLAPIRSARSYFVDWASGFNQPLYVHVGGANLPGPADALGQISDYGWNGENDFNQFSIGYPTFVRDYNRVPGKEIATEHTMVTSTEKLWQLGEEREWTNMSPERKVGYKVVESEDWKDGFESWSFQDSQPESGTVNEIAYDFWSGYGDYSVRWEYDSESNSYQRFMGGESHIDMNNDQQIMAKNVIVLLTTEKGPIDEKKHLLYGTTGSGDALLFHNGEATEVTWTKKTRTSQLGFVDSQGKPVLLSRGLTWISTVSDDTEVSY